MSEPAGSGCVELAKGPLTGTAEAAPASGNVEIKKVSNFR
jgi:hypothetical protein